MERGQLKGYGGVNGCAGSMLGGNKFGRNAGSSGKVTRAPMSADFVDSPAIEEICAQFRRGAFRFLIIVVFFAENFEIRIAKFAI